MTPVEFFNALGAFEAPVTAAHCVWVNQNDIEILDEHGVFIANNPVSNMKLGSGFAPVPKMFSRGMNVCLGSDGMASNNSHNLFNDLYVMALVYKGFKLDPTVIKPAQGLRAATRTGALSQGRTDSGLIKEGFKADLCVLDVTGPQWCPMTDALTNIIFAGDGSNVVLTVSDGRVIFDANGPMGTKWPGLDIEEIRAEVEYRANRIIQSLT